MLGIAEKMYSNKIENLYISFGVFILALWLFSFGFQHIHNEEKSINHARIDETTHHLILLNRIFSKNILRIFVADSELDAPESLLSIELNVNKQNVQIAICAKLIYLCDSVGNKSWIDKSDSHQQLQWMTFGWQRAKKKKSEKCAWLMSRAQHSTITQNGVVYWNIYHLYDDFNRSM